MKFAPQQEEVAEAFFDELKDTFFFQLHRMQKAFFRHSNRLMQESGIDLQLEQFPVLMVVHAMKNPSQREIADVTMRDKSSIQRSVIALEKKGLLTIEQDGLDKRKHIIMTTPAGEELAKKTKLLILKAEEEVFSVFIDQERTQALQSMRDIADKLEKR